MAIPTHSRAMDFAPASTAVRVLTYDPPLNCPDCAVHMTQDGIALQARGFSTISLR